MLQTYIRSISYKLETLNVNLKEQRELTKKNNELLKTQNELLKRILEKNNR